MTADELAAIQARAAAATEGPWHLATVWAMAGQAVIRQSRPLDAPIGEEAPDVLRLESGDFASNLMQDAVFIAQARADVPALLAYIGELEAELATLRS